MQQQKSLCYNFTLVKDTQKAKRYFVTGMVQGVGFRYFTREVAQRLRLGGYVRNLPDGRVEVYAMGTTEQHSKLLAAIERGPSGASVSEVQQEDVAADVRYAETFSVTY
jgi:acylphosphatase